MCKQPVTNSKTQQTYSCGKCDECHTRYIQHWVFRLQQEHRQTNQGVFLTLTYDYNHIPMNKGKFTLHKPDYQKFLKRLRKALPFKKIKYVVCGEYGDKNNRPHYHLILLGIDNEEFNTINKSWGMGQIHIGSVTPASIAYTFKYSVKGDKKHRDWRQQKQFVAMSKGIGEDFAFDIQYEKTTYKYEKNIITGISGSKVNWKIIREQNWYDETEIKILTRYKKIRIPKPHFAKKLQTLLQMPYYNIPSSTGGTVKMSIPKFYLRASSYDTTELTEKYLDKMAEKNKHINDPSLINYIVTTETKQRSDSVRTFTKKVLHSISKEKI